MSESADIVVIGAGAAGLMASIAAGRAARSAGTSLKIVALDGAKKIGAKILVAGGGRCNVAHCRISENDYAGGSRNTIKKVLRSFTVEDTVQFFSDLGVTFKIEETGKLFPTTDNARTVLNALLSAAQLAEVRIIHPWRVESVTRSTRGQFEIFRAPNDNLDTQPDALIANRIILATGGRSLPKTGSDGQGYRIAKSLGHSLSERIFPALVPLTVDSADTFVPSLSGVSCIATLEVRASTGKRIASFTNSLLCTHFGISGPCALDISRYYLDAKAHDPDTVLIINWLPQFTPQTLDEAIRSLGKGTVLTFCRSYLAERLVRCICESAKVDPSTAGHSLTRDQRRTLVRSLVEMPLPITGDRGFAHAEVTAGGVPLTEVDVRTMESRVCPGMHLVGEILDVDGRIGGFNFQWAWATGHIGGTAAAKSLQSEL